MKAVIFDMDGVIVDSEGFWKQAEFEVFSSLGVHILEEHAEKTRSMTTAEVTQFWFEKYPWTTKSLPEVEQMVVLRVIELIKTEECRIKGVKRFIERLKENGYKIGLATNSPFKIIPVVLKKHKIEHLFDVVSSSKFCKKGKPDPEIYLSTSAKLNVRPEQCFVVEDSYSGLQAAKKAGMKTIVFTNGQLSTVPEIADHKIDDFDCSLPYYLN